jgi:small subunit ribosomal protein S6
MKLYEVTFLSRQELSPAQVEELTNEMQKIITDAKGKVHKTEQWGLKTLAYRINKSRKANYTLMEIETEAEALHEMERQMRIHNDVVRYMSLKIDEVSKDPSPMMKSYEKSDQKEAA